MPETYRYWAGLTMAIGRAAADYVVGVPRLRRPWRVTSEAYSCAVRRERCRKLVCSRALHCPHDASGRASRPRRRPAIAE